MAQPSDGAAILGPHYCFPFPVDIAFVKTTTAGASFAITDMKGNVLFKINEKVPSLKKKTILDASGNPIITLLPKGLSIHSRWQAYRGESTSPKDLIFTAKQHSLFYWRMKVDVFLANNKAEKVCDFKVEGSFSKHSSVVYAGDGHSNTIVAQIQKSETGLQGKDDFLVRVCPKTDYGFIAALMVIVQDLNLEEKLGYAAAGAGVGAGFSC